MPLVQFIEILVGACGAPCVVQAAGQVLNLVVPAAMTLAKASLPVVVTTLWLERSSCRVIGAAAGAA